MKNTKINTGIYIILISILIYFMTQQYNNTLPSTLPPSYEENKSTENTCENA
mgnify:FL=1